MFRLEKQKDKAVLTIYGYVGGYYMDMRDVNAALHEITSMGYKKLDFRFHTYGGSVIDGNLIYNFLASFQGEVDVYIDGVAASMGSVVMMAGVRIHIAENGFVMIHRPSGSVEGNAQDMIQYSKLLTSIEKNFKEKLQARTGKTEAEVSAWFDGADHWFDADECIALGLCDTKFSAKVLDLNSLNKKEVEEIGAKAVYDRFTALVNPNSLVNNKSEQMDKKTLIARYGLTTVTEASTDEEVMAAIDAKMAASENSAKEELKKAVTSTVAAGVKAGKITAEQSDRYIAIGLKVGIEELNSILADLKAYEPISKHIKPDKSDETEDEKARANWKWNDYQEKDSLALEAMVKKDPEKFKALYKAEYGVEPEL